MAKRARQHTAELWLLALEAEGRYLLHPPSASGLLAGLWRWPTLDAAALPATADSASSLRAWPGWTQVYTHRREAVSPLHLQRERAFPAPEGLLWVPQVELGALPLGKRDQRLRDLLATPGERPLTAPEPADLIRALGHRE